MYPGAADALLLCGQKFPYADIGILWLYDASDALHTRSKMHEEARKIIRCPDRRFDAILHCAVLGGPSKELVQYVHILVHQLHDWELFNCHKSPHDDLSRTLCIKRVQVNPAWASLFWESSAMHRVGSF